MFFNDIWYKLIPLCVSNSVVTMCTLLGISGATQTLKSPVLDVSLTRIVSGCLHSYERNDTLPSVT